MAKKQKKQRPALPEKRDMGEALAQLEQPKMKWKVVAQIAVGFIILWVIAGMLSPYLGIWGFVGAGVLTLIALGFAFYIWRMTKKSSNIMGILKGATDEEGRKRAIEALQSQGDGDAMAKLAEAQLVAQEDPKAAMEVLESIDIPKAPKLVQNDVRAQLGLMYLIHGRAKDARALADAITLEAQPQPKQKAMYAAVMCEAWARTGKADEAAKLLSDYDPEDPAYDDMQALLYRAQIFVSLKKKKKGRARTAMMRLARIDANQLGAFLQKGTHPEVKRLAMEVLQKEGYAPKQRVQFRTR
ncbi:MAG: hypothetical protein AAF411_05075 [Myxococcota bacterium]